MLLFCAVPEVKAQDNDNIWNPVGVWYLGYEIQDGNYQWQMDITSWDDQSGAFTATLLNWPEGVVSDGVCQGSDISFDINWYTGQAWNGSIASDGTMSGGMSQDGWSGFWYTESGQATPVTVPEPHTTSILLCGLAAAISLRACLNDQKC